MAETKPNTPEARRETDARGIWNERSYKIHKLAEYIAGRGRDCPKCPEHAEQAGREERKVD